MLKKLKYYPPNIRELNIEINKLIAQNLKKKFLTVEMEDALKLLKYYNFLDSRVKNAEIYTLTKDKFYSLANMNLTTQVVFGLSSNSRKTLQENFKDGRIPYPCLIYLKKPNIEYIVGGLSYVVYNFKIINQVDMKVLKIIL